MKYMLALLLMFEVPLVLAEARVRSGSVSFLAKGNPGFMKIEGKGPEGMRGVLDGQRGKFIFPLKNLETGIDLRDEHMKEKYLEVEKFPDAVLELLNAENLTGPGSDSSGSFRGRLTLHGVTKEVSGEYEFSGTKLIASFSIKLSDFGIDVPSWMGVTVADIVDLKTDISF